MSKGNGSAGRAARLNSKSTSKVVTAYGISEAERVSAMAENARTNSNYITALRETEGRGGPLTHEEAASIYEYTDYGSWDRADKILSGQSLSRNEKALVATVDKALTKLPTMKTTTYRGLGMSDKELGGLKVGGIWQSQNYMSTAASKTNAENFADSRADGSNKVVLRVHGGAKDITRYSRYRMEREGLVARGEKYTISGIKKRGDYTYIDLKK